jgi:hypothetical protein
VRILLVVLLALTAVGWVLCGLEANPWEASVRSAEKPFGWRRTDQGWEKSHDWWKAEPRRLSVGARLSPMSVAAFEVAVSLAGLALFANREKENGKKTRRDVRRGPACPHYYQ